ncbi:hypothetical protein [Epilithonimonas zeae]|uniref:hypothetical protein n=1 Tax=Epilithonimonas zeae TaxID=1416779 RepID=UPI00200F3AD6|nr:hypothetical protein [Epilithonimonas zeae]UQB69891.1 hypothetical protein KI430_05545 [Epilithonimonas zeae]
MKKSTVIILIIGLLILLFIDRCTTINLTTADIFRPKSYNHFKELTQKPQSENFEIVPALGTFPILYNSVKNEFYLKNGQGLTKYDASGNLMISNDLNKEKYTSIFDFSNFVPYVFAENGVYDFSGNRLIYSKFSQILNVKNELSDKEFKSIFEENYRQSNLVIYDTDRNIESGRNCFPMYFRIGENWILMFSQKDDYRFSHQGNEVFESDTIGQIDFKGFPAKFFNQGLTVLKDFKTGLYSINQLGKEKIDDDYLNKYYTQILKEKNLDYQTDSKIKLLSRKKDDYYETGNPFSLPQWVAPSFINTAYYSLTYQNEKLFFKAKAVKMYDSPTAQNDLYLYELPKQFRIKSKLAFIDYGLDIGGYMDMNSGEIDPIIKNTGLYLIKLKKK